MCARKDVVFPVVVPGGVQNVKNCAKLAEFLALHAKEFYQLTTFQQLMCHKGYPFLWICASKDMDLGPNFVQVRVLWCCPSRDVHFPNGHPPG